MSAQFRSPSPVDDSGQGPTFALIQFNDDGRVIGCLGQGTWAFVDLTTLQTGGQCRRQQKVIDADASIVLECQAKVVPKGELSGFAWM